MPWYDLPLKKLREYRTSTQEPGGLDDLWARKLHDARAVAREPGIVLYKRDLYHPVEVYDAEFSGAGGDRIHLREHLPA